MDAKRVRMMPKKAPNSGSDNQSPREDLPQEITESLGTGVQEAPGYNIGGRTMWEPRGEDTETSPELGSDDADTYWEDADAVGEEAVGGSVSIPEHDLVDENGAAVGLEMDERAFLRTNEILEERDDRRYELDPTSSEDYQERRD
jgi:Family of unknown function (DUF6335)